MSRRSGSDRRKGHRTHPSAPLEAEAVVLPAAAPPAGPGARIRVDVIGGHSVSRGSRPRHLEDDPPGAISVSRWLTEGDAGTAGKKAAPRAASRPRRARVGSVTLVVASLTLLAAVALAAGGWIATRDMSHTPAPPPEEVVAEAPAPPAPPPPVKAPAMEPAAPERREPPEPAAPPPSVVAFVAVPMPISPPSPASRASRAVAPTKRETTTAAVRKPRVAPSVADEVWSLAAGDADPYAHVPPRAKTDLIDLEQQISEHMAARYDAIPPRAAAAARAHTGPSSAAADIAEGAPADDDDPPPPKVLVTSDPSGADVYVDGRRVGHTPYYVAIGPENKGLTIAHKDFLPEVATVPKDLNPRLMRFSLRRR